VSSRTELYGTATCQATQEMREWLEWRGVNFHEFDVETDDLARARLRALAGEQRTVPVLVEDGCVVQVGWQGRGCIIRA
jgi:mycoredoxin